MCRCPRRNIKDLCIRFVLDRGAAEYGQMAPSSPSHFCLVADRYSSNDSRRFMRVPPRGRGVHPLALTKPSIRVVGALTRCLRTNYGRSIS